MTCIIGYKENDAIWLASDGMCTDQENRYRIEENYPKVFEKDNILFGTSGSMRVSQLIQYSLNIPYHDPRLSDMHYLCGPFSQEIMILLGTTKSLEVNDEIAYFNAGILIAYNGELYHMMDDFFVSKSREKYDTVGSGMFIALGSLYTTSNEDIPTETKITKALDAACKFSPSCGGSYHIMMRIMDTTVSYEIPVSIHR